MCLQSQTQSARGVGAEPEVWEAGSVAGLCAELDEERQGEMGDGAGGAAGWGGSAAAHAFPVAGRGPGHMISSTQSTGHEGNVRISGRHAAQRSKPRAACALLAAHDPSSERELKTGGLSLTSLKDGKHRKPEPAKRPRLLNQPH